METTFLFSADRHGIYAFTDSINDLRNYRPVSYTYFGKRHHIQSLPIIGSRLKQVYKNYQNYRITYAKLLKLGTEIHGDNFDIYPNPLICNMYEYFKLAAQFGSKFIIRYPKIKVKSSEDEKLYTNIYDLYVFADIIHTLNRTHATRLYGYQAGFTEQQYSSSMFLHPHLRGQNDSFCLGSTTLQVTLDIFKSCNLLEDNDEIPDAFEDLLYLIDSLVNYQSEEGGPYRHIRSLYNNEIMRDLFEFSNQISSYYINSYYPKYLGFKPEKLDDKTIYFDVDYEHVLYNINHLLKTKPNLIDRSTLLFLNSNKYDNKSFKIVPNSIRTYQLYFKGQKIKPKEIINDDIIITPSHNVSTTVPIKFVNSTINAIQEKLLYLINNS